MQDAGNSEDRRDWFRTILPKHHLRIDAKSDLRVAMADLPHDVWLILAGSEQQ
jgi:hypothetical protein